MSKTTEKQDSYFSSDEQFNGWPALKMANKWLTMHITPQIGGRIMQLSLDGHPYFFNNPTLSGYLPEKGEDQKDWLNFGGEKIWPAPQGWGSPDLWPGPPDPVLDGGVYSWTPAQIANFQGQAVCLQSLTDPYTGLQITKEIRVQPDMAGVCVDVDFHNHSQVTRNWSVWPVLQLDTANWKTAGPYRVSCPMDVNSQFPEGYKVMHGLVNNPQFSQDGHHNLLVDYQFIVGKVGLDCRAGWVAFANLRTGNVLVAGFDYQKDAIYPDLTSVQLWMQGQGQIYSRNQLRNYPDDPQVNWPYLEIELLSPLYSIQPGKHISFSYTMLCCKVVPGTYVIRKGTYGVVTSSLKVRRQADILAISGSYGFFTEGIARLELFSIDGQWLSGHLNSFEASPLSALSLNADLSLEKLSPSAGLFIKLNFYHPVSGELLETLDQCTYALIE